MQQDLSQARQLLEHFLQCYFVERDLEKTMACLTLIVKSLNMHILDSLGLKMEWLYDKIHSE